MNEALRDGSECREHLTSSDVAGPHPIEAGAATFQSVTATKVRTRRMKAKGPARYADRLHRRRIRTRSGLVHPFLDDTPSPFTASKGAARGLRTGRHAASLAGAGRGGCRALSTHRPICGQHRGREESGRAFPLGGLDYPGIGPRACLDQGLGRVQYFHATDAEALEAFQHAHDNSRGDHPALGQLMRWPCREKCAHGCPGFKSSASASPAAATRTSFGRGEAGVKVPRVSTVASPRSKRRAARASSHFIPAGDPRSRNSRCAAEGPARKEGDDISSSACLFRFPWPDGPAIRPPPCGVEGRRLHGQDLRARQSVREG